MYQEHPNAAARQASKSFIEQTLGTMVGLLLEYVILQGVALLLVDGGLHSVPNALTFKAGYAVACLLIFPVVWSHLQAQGKRLERKYSEEEGASAFIGLASDCVHLTSKVIVCMINWGVKAAVATALVHYRTGVFTVVDLVIFLALGVTFASLDWGVEAAGDLLVDGLVPWMDAYKTRWKGAIPLSLGFVLNQMLTSYWMWSVGKMMPSQHANGFLGTAVKGIWFLVISTVITLLVAGRFKSRHRGVPGPLLVADPKPGYDELKGLGEGAIAFVYAWAMYGVLVELFFRVMSECEPDPQIKIPYPRYCKFQENFGFALLTSITFLIFSILNKITNESSWWVLSVHALQNKAFTIITGWGWYCYVASQIHHTAKLNLQDDPRGLFAMTAFLLVLFSASSLYLFNMYMAIHRDMDNTKKPRPQFSEHEYLNKEHEQNF
jgi:hypothetical protein